MSHAIPSGSSPFYPPYALTRAPTSHNCRNLPFVASLLASAPRLTQPKVGWKLLPSFSSHLLSSPIGALEAHTRSWESDGSVSGHSGAANLKGHLFRSPMYC